MKKVIYIVSDIDKALAFEWIAYGIDKNNFKLSFILINPGSSQLEQFLITNNIPVTRVTSAGKKDWIKAWLKIYGILKKEKPDVVHCHLLQANILGLTAAKVAGIKSRIYTRHHSSLHHVYHPKGVFWDKLANRNATKIVSISDATKKILIEKEKVSIKKIISIPHGFDLEAFKNIDQKRVDTLKGKYFLKQSFPIVGVMSRFTKWKGVQYIIPAFKELLCTYPKAKLALFGVGGDYKQEIDKLLNELHKENYIAVDFETDNAAALKAMDIFVHVPIDEHSEAFGQIYVEALAVGVPSIFTLSGIAPSFIENKKNALIVPFEDSNAIYNAMIDILENKALSEKLREQGYYDVKDLFDLKTMITKLEEIYAQ